MFSTKAQFLRTKVRASWDFSVTLLGKFAHGLASNIAKATHWLASHRPSWKRVGEILEPVQHFVIVAVTLTVAGVLVWYGWSEAKRRIVVLDPIGVPKQFVDSGLTSEVLTRRVREKLEEIQAINDSPSSRDQVSMSSDQAYPDIEVPETKLSLQVVVDLFRRLLGTEPQQLSGEITVTSRVAKAEFQCRLLRLGQLVQ